MSVYVSTTYLGDKSDLQKAVCKLKENGINKIELGSNHEQMTKDKIFRFALDDRESGYNDRFIAHNYFPPGDPNFVLNIASQNNKTKEASIKFIKNTIKLCQTLKIKYYTIHPGFLGEVSKRKKSRGRNFDFEFKNPNASKSKEKIVSGTTKTIKQLYQYAEKHNIQLLIENEGSQTVPDFVIFATYEELESLRKAIGPRLKFNFNLAHATLAGINLSHESTFLHFYRQSAFFEVSEIEGIYDSHLPISKRGKISSLLTKYANHLKRKNVILEYRSVKLEEVKKSFDYVSTKL